MIVNKANRETLQVRDEVKVDKATKLVEFQDTVRPAIEDSKKVRCRSVQDQTQLYHSKSEEDQDINQILTNSEIQKFNAFLSDKEVKGACKRA